MERRIHTVGRAIVIAALFAAAFGAVYLVAFSSSAGLQADAAIFHRVSQADVEQVRRIGRHIGRHALDAIAIAAVVAVAASLSLLAFLRRRPAHGWAVPILLVGSFATTEVIKPPLGRLGRHLAPGRIASDSFPSGHATIAMAVVLAAVIAAPAVLRTAAVVIGTIYATLAALLIVAVGLHPPSDVLGGYLVSGTWAALLLAFLGRRGDTSQAPAKRDRRRGQLAVIAGLAFLVIVILALSSTPGFSAAGQHRTFLATTAAFATAAAAIVFAVAWLSADRETRAD